jgi:hypothetical protein
LSNSESIIADEQLEFIEDADWGCCYGRCWYVASVIPLGGASNVHCIHRLEHSSEKESL